jgi:hypothetical protein
LEAVIAEKDQRIKNLKEDLKEDIEKRKILEESEKILTLDQLHKQYFLIIILTLTLII